MIRTIIAKELRALFTSPLAWVVLAFLQIILAWIFLTRVDYFLTIQPQLARVPNAPGLSEIVVVPMFGIASIVLLMSVPLLMGGKLDYGLLGANLLGLLLLTSSFAAIGLFVSCLTTHPVVAAIGAL